MSSRADELAKPLKPVGSFNLFGRCRELRPNIHHRLKSDPAGAEKEQGQPCPHRPCSSLPVRLQLLTFAVIIPMR